MIHHGELENSSGRMEPPAQGRFEGTFALEAELMKEEPNPRVHLTGSLITRFTVSHMVSIKSINVAS